MFYYLCSKIKYNTVFLTLVVITSNVSVILQITLAHLDRHIVVN